MENYDSVESCRPTWRNERSRLPARRLHQAGDLRNWLLLVSAALSAVAVFSLLQAHGAGARWTGCLSIVLLLAIACDSRLRAIFAHAWSHATAFAGDRANLPWRTALLLVALPNLLLVLCHGPGIQTGDSRPVVMTAASLMTDCNLEISEFAELYRQRHYYTLAGEDLPYFVIQRPAGLFSHYPSGMVPFALPVVAAARMLGTQLEEPIVQQHLEQVTAALVAAACTMIFFLLALHLARPATALVATAILATGSVMYSTIGQALWQHGGVIFWTEVLLLIEFRTWRRPSLTTIGVQGLAMAMMTACRLSAGPIVATFWLWVAVRSPTRAIKLAGLAAVAWLPWVAVNWSVYGNLTGPMVVQTNGLLWSFGTATSWAGILLSPTHGLVIYQPWLLLALAAFWPRKDDVERDEDKSPPGWQAWVLAVIALHLTVVSSWWCWWGGLCWGSRLASEIVPLAALVCLQPLAALFQSRTGRSVVYALAAVSFLLHVPSVWLRQDRWYDGMGAEAQLANAWPWRSPPFLYPLKDL